MRGRQQGKQSAGLSLPVNPTYLLLGKEIIHAINFDGTTRALELTVRCFVLLDGEHHLGELGNRIVLINNIYIDIILYAVTCLFSCLSFN